MKRFGILGAASISFFLFFLGGGIMKEIWNFRGRLREKVGKFLTSLGLKKTNPYVTW